MDLHVTSRISREGRGTTMTVSTEIGLQQARETISQDSNQVLYKTDTRVELHVRNVDHLILIWRRTQMF
jgi:hypothetical protein